VEGSTLTLGEASSDREQEQVRAALKQSLFREVNERVAELRPTAMFVEFTCECLTAECTASLPMTVEEYEHMRRIPTHFAVLPGHEDDVVERVVEETDRYWIVE
jgi:hypothetical protein